MAGKSKGVEGGKVYVTIVSDAEKFADDAEKEITRGVAGGADKGADKAKKVITKGVSEGAEDGAREGAKKGSKELEERFRDGAKAAGVAAGAAIAVGLSSAMDHADLEGSIRAQFDTTDSYVKEIAETSSEVYAAGWGENLDEIGKHVTTLADHLNELGTDESLKDLSVNVNAVAGTFDQDASAMIRSMRSMIQNGLSDSMSESLDLLTTGFKSNGAMLDDQLSVMDEFGVHFQALGLSGADAVSLMDQGLQAGAFSASVIGDAAKEFNILARETDTTGEHFKTLGMDAEASAKAVAAGGEGAREVFSNVLDGLRNMKDPLLQSTTAVGLFGGKSEDLQQALISLDLNETTEGLKNVDGAATRVAENSAGFQQSLTAMGRSLSIGLGEALVPLLPMLADLSSLGLTFFKWLAENPLVTQIILGIGAALGLAAVSMWAFNAAQLANPTTWIMAGIIAGILLVGAAVYWLATNWDIAMDSMRTAGEHVTTGLLHAVNGIIKALNGIGQLAAIITPGKQDWGSMALLDVPGLATGGTVTGRGTVLVGEEGPELLNLSRGASVIPLDHPAAGAGNGGGTLNYYAAENRSFDAEAEFHAALGKTHHLGR